MVSGKPPRRSKSPNDPVTIDLTADPIAADTTAQPEPTDRSETIESDGITATSAPSETDQVSSNGPSDPAPDETAAERSASEAETPIEPATTAAAETPTSEPTPPARSGPALPALIAAGIFGGLVALAGAGSMQYAGYLPAVGRETAPPVDMSGLSADVEALKSQLAGLANAPAAPTDPRLEERLAALETAVTNQASTAADTAALDELRQRLVQADEALAALKGETAGNASALTETETRLTERLAAAEKKLEEPRTDVEMAKAIALTALKSATERGGPFMAELDALASITPDDPAVERLRPHAATGIASRAELVRKFGNVADTILSAIHQPDPNEGIGQRLLSSALSVVKVRPVGNVEGTTPEAILARMEDKLQNGDLKGASLEWESLPEQGKAVSTDYVSTLKTRIEIETVVGDALATVVAGKKG
ncbi:MAG: COG4223 family protein [Rhizobium sp.]|nr:COG4223 family protein [Rhizobium sp.]